MGIHRLVNLMGNSSRVSGFLYFVPCTKTIQTNEEAHLWFGLQQAIGYHGDVVQMQPGILKTWLRSGIAHGNICKTPCGSQAFAESMNAISLGAFADAAKLIDTRSTPITIDICGASET